LPFSPKLHTQTKSENCPFRKIENKNETEEKKWLDFGPYLKTVKKLGLPPPL
jgi:hypothetical protein